MLASLDGTDPKQVSTLFLVDCNIAQSYLDSDIVPLIPVLISLLNRSSTESELFVAASDALQEIMSKSPLSDGSGSKTLTEPLLLWIDATGSRIVDAMLNVGDVDEVSHSFCKLLVALGEHSTSYIAINISSTALVAPPVPSSLPPSPVKTKGYLTQAFLRILLAYTGLPGYYGVDEEESEITLSFWYLFQEALWSVDFEAPEGDEDNGSSSVAEQRDEQVAMAKAVYSELVQVLRRKVGFPTKGNAWSKGLFSPPSNAASAYHVLSRSNRQVPSVSRFTHEYYTKLT